VSRTRRRVQTRVFDALPDAAPHSGNTDVRAAKFVMAGLDPAIHVFLGRHKDVDGRNKSGHDRMLLRENLRRPPQSIL